MFCISAVWTAPFIIHLLESIISKLYTSEDSIFWLVSVAEQAGLSLALSENPKADFAASWISVCAVCLCPQNDADQSFSALLSIIDFTLNYPPIRNNLTSASLLSMLIETDYLNYPPIRINLTSATPCSTGCFDDRLLTMMTDTGFYVPWRVGYNFRSASCL